MAHFESGKLPSAGGNCSCRSPRIHPHGVCGGLSQSLLQDHHTHLSPSGDPAVPRPERKPLQCLQVSFPRLNGRLLCQGCHGQGAILKAQLHHLQLVRDIAWLHARRPWFWWMPRIAASPCLRRDSSCSRAGRQLKSASTQR